MGHGLAGIAESAGLIELIILPAKFQIPPYEGIFGKQLGELEQINIQTVPAQLGVEIRDALKIIVVFLNIRLFPG